MILDWINHRFGLSLEEKQLAEVKNFSLLWNILEGKHFGTSFSVGGAEKLVNNTTFNNDAFQSHLKYFRERYVEAGHTNYRFPYLNLRPNDKQNLVEAVLLNTTNDEKHIILALLIIVYRYRNNLFHGTKEIDEIVHQDGNFSCANSFLMTFLDHLPV